MQPEVLAHHPFNPVAGDCVPHLFTHGKAKAESALACISVFDEQDEISGEMLPAPFITNRELGTFEQPTLLVPS